MARQIKQAFNNVVHISPTNLVQRVDPIRRIRTGNTRGALGVDGSLHLHRTQNDIAYKLQRTLKSDVDSLR